MISLILTLALVGIDTRTPIKHGERDRAYEVHMDRATQGQPVVIGLHGGGSNITQFKVQSGLDRLGDKAIVAYGEGTGPKVLGPGAYTWNSGDCCGYAQTNQVDDIGYLDAVINDLSLKYNIDTRRVYVCGMSNGGQMAYKYAANRPKRVAAICSVACSMSRHIFPTGKVAILEIHGLEDPNSPFGGGFGKNAISKVDHLPSKVCANLWVIANNADRGLEVVTREYVLYRWGRKANDPTSRAVNLFAVKNSGHNWPGGVDLTQNLGTGPFNKYFNTNQVMWDFFMANKLELEEVRAVEELPKP